jgi:excisionase family DNA binding protein
MPTDEERLEFKRSELAAARRLFVPEPLTTSEVAARLGNSPANVRQAIARGTLRAMKHGRDWLVEPSELERYLAQRSRSIAR